MLQDLRYAVRYLSRSRMFSVSVVLTLALGIGANSAIFSALNTLLLKDLPIQDPGGLIGVTSRDSRDRERYVPFLVVKELTRDGPFREVCGYNGGAILPIEANARPTQAVVAFVSGRCFDVWGVQPVVGRVITDEDAPLASAGSRVVTISHGFWTRMYGADQDVVGKTIKTSGTQATIVGVLPKGFGGIHVDSAIDIFAPPDSLIPARPDRRPVASQILGRLKAGTSLEQAKAQLNARWPELLKATVPSASSAQEGTDLFGATLRVEPIGKGLSTFRERYSPALKLVFGLTAVLLLLAAANLGGLLLARFEARGQEIAIRTALGGKRSRIALQLFAESLLLCVTGSIFAVPLAMAIDSMLVSFIPPSLVATSLDLSPDWRVIGLMALVSVAVASLMTAFPLWTALRGNTMTLELRGGRTVMGANRFAARAILVAQVALSTTLLIGAGILVTSLFLLRQTSLGVRTENVINIKALAVPDGYRGVDTASYYSTLLGEISGLPGVESVGLARSFPRTVTEPVSTIAFVGEELGEVRAYLDAASPGFFPTVAIPIISGRVPTFDDSQKTKKVAAVSEALARSLDSTGEVIGRRVRLGTDRNLQDIEIIGVVGSATIGNPRNAKAPVLYVSPLQLPGFSNPNILIATAVDDQSLGLKAGQILQNAKREYPHEIIALDDVFKRAPSTELMTATLAGAVGIFALLLAVIGIQSAFSYTVARRTREIGVRMAIGALPQQMASAIVKEALIVTVMGVAIGVAGALLGSRAVSSLTFGIRETDPWAISACIAVIVISALTAAAVPAMRAARIDPVTALRQD